MFERPKADGAIDPRAAVPGLELTSLDKVIWPSSGFTKGEMLGYYARVAPTLLAHLADRPLTLGRFPNGVDRPGFAQTECRGRPAWVMTAVIRLRDGRPRNFCLAHDLRSLLWIANLGTIELHTFLAPAHALEQPQAVLFDIDPEPPAGIVEAAETAVLLRDRLDRQALVALVKSTGGAGLHVVVPLNSPHTYAQTKAFARRQARELAAAHRWIIDSAAARDRRPGTILIDWAQNSERRTIIAPYSLRASDEPAVSTPVTWEEVEAGADLRLGPGDALERIERLGDLFEPALETVQSIK